MINRLFDRSFGRQNFSFDRGVFRGAEDPPLPFEFALKQDLAFAADLQQQLLKLEERFAREACSHRDAHNSVLAEPALDCRCQRCTYDDFGLVEGLDLDPNWM
jgi:hypothetical protein